MNSLHAPFTKLSRAVKERGWWGVVIQLYTIGDLKFGELKGSDKFGNKYYENIELPYGQHRWVEFSNIHDPDATMIQPEWHGWMHHVFDETPDEMDSRTVAYIPTTSDSHAIYTHHIGLNRPVAFPTVNTSQYRQRGWKVGSRMTGPEDADNYYLQPGHALSPLADKGGRFKDEKYTEEWDPNAQK
mmetsp:Transcript_18964/g.19084  ORF Transcript_18964/g.19084 Transcript_18964/m.19084 type:complete len:186 (+) Transcript_18964:98-655(+)|eukprot:CAMPEP_0182419666 /NCGR_PEP_ID=MMETSP1167-20130531/4068_1 /TAXON_ID=2988 /ORGANISM="Mallomonas Sp, Strain CCMP3275" /LENGTH=185 /DNA_ID=CAMNT_0024594711 /DNA_START=84 /DNA_END=641 /DNA_ORIENTATION=-